MKVALVSPEFPNKGGFPLAPPILEYLGALTLRHSPGAELELLDANRRTVSAGSLGADLVGISVMTPTADWSYALSDALRARGVQVVLGGIHPSILPNEARMHADAVVVGEAESVWGQVLADAARRRLQPVYRGERVSLEGLPPPLRGRAGRYPFRAVFTARGCIHRCSFCSVRAFFGASVRHRPIREVQRDVEETVGRMYYNGDDNIWGADVERSIELFRALASGSRKWWFGQGDLASIQQPRGAEMLEWARRSGLRSIWVGYESHEESTLRSYRARAKQGPDRDSAIERIRDAGIEVVFFVILGGREDSLATFDEALELSDRLRITIHPVLLTPYPGTELYDAYQPFLLSGVPWREFDGVHAVFEHAAPDMMPAARRERILKLNRDLFTLRRIFSRTAAVRRGGWPVAHTIALMKQMGMRRGFRAAYERFAREPRYPPPPASPVARDGAGETAPPLARPRGGR